MNWWKIVHYFGALEKDFLITIRVFLFIAEGDWWIDMPVILDNFCPANFISVNIGKG